MKSTQLSLKVDGIGLLVTNLWGFQEGGKGGLQIWSSGSLKKEVTIYMGLAAVYDF